MGDAEAICEAGRPEDEMIGQTFGRLTVTAQAPSSGGKRRWVCTCSCGNVTTSFAWKLLAGKARSCGCLKAEELNAGQGHELHGMRDSPEYRIWSLLKQWCHNPEHRAYSRYGGAGVKMHPQWVGSFLAFQRDVGRRPSADHQLKRYDDTGHFVPGNCRWVLLPKSRRSRLRI